MSRFFISHAGKDYREARALRQWLIAQEPPLANEIFLDVERADGIQIGNEWVDELRRAGYRAETIICLLSPTWEKSAECRAEFRLATYLSRRILCARLEPYEERSITADWQRCDLFGDGPKEEIDIGDGKPPVAFAQEGLRRLKDGIRGSGLEALSFPWPAKPDETPVPYRGREPYDEHDAGVFFGRDAAIIDSLQRIQDMRVGGRGYFVVRGPTGAGLTSFLRAGLVPRLRINDVHYVVLDVVKCGHDVLTGEFGLAQAIFGLRQKLNIGGMDLGDIKEICQRRHDKVPGILAECQCAAADSLPADDRDDRLPTVVLPLDNAEALCATDAGLEELEFRELLQLIGSDPVASATLIVTLAVHSHNYSPLLKPKALLADRDPVVVDLAPIQDNRFEAIIKGPMERSKESKSPFVIETTLVQRLLDDYSDGTAMLPLLSLCMRDLVVDYANDRSVTLDEYNGSESRINQLLQREVNGAIAAGGGDRDTELTALHDAFIPWLVTVDDDGRPTGARPRWTDLPQRSQQAVNRLVDKRLLFKDVDDDGNTVVRLATNRLLSAWQELAGWIVAESSNIKNLKAIDQSYRDWRDGDKDAGHLLSREKLRLAEPLERSPQYSGRLAPMRSFLAASRSARIASLRKWLAVVSLLAVVASACAAAAVISTIDAHRQRNNARNQYMNALSTQLIAEAGNMLTGRRSDGDERALQQILASRSLADTPDYNALYAAATQLASTTKIIDAPQFLHGIAVSRDGKYVASASFTNQPEIKTGRVRIWEAASGKLVGTPERDHPDNAWNVAFSPDGQTLVSGSSDGTLQRWDTATGQPKEAPMTGHTNQVYAVAYNNDGTRIVSSGQDGTIIQWNAKSGKQIGEPIDSQSGVVWTVAYSPDGSRIVSGAADGTVRQWSADSGAPLGRPLKGSDDNIWSVAYSRDGQRIVSGSQDTTIRQWQAVDGTPILPVITGHRATISGVTYVADTHDIVAGSTDGIVRQWDGDTGRPIGPPLQGQTNAIMSVAVDYNGDRIVSGSSDNTIRIWRPNVIGLGGPLQRVAFSRDQSVIASSMGTTVSLWSSDGQLVGSPIETGSPVTALALGGDGTRIASGGADGVVRAWDSGGRTVGVPMNGHTGKVLSVAVNARGDRVVCGGADGTVRVWNIATGREVVPTMMIPGSPQVQAVAFSPDGSQVVAGSDDNVARLWNADTGEFVRDFRGNLGEITSIEFNDDGSRLVAGGLDTMTHLFDTASGQQLQYFPGHHQTVSSVAMDPFGKYVLSGSDDQSVRLWDASNGRLIGTPINGLAARIVKVAFSPDGKTFTVAAADGTVARWPTEATEEDLCAKLTVNISKTRWPEWVAHDVDWRELCKGLPERVDR
jgi:WD40 repeat protein